jgi:hypothetical protein
LRRWFVSKFLSILALMIFLPNFLSKKVLQNRVFCRFGAGIRSCGVKSILRKIFWEEKLLCVKASLCKNCFSVKTLYSVFQSSAWKYFAQTL